DITGNIDEVILNRALANELWPKQDAVGKTVRLDDPSTGLSFTVRVAGVVADQRLSGPGYSAVPTAFLPLRGVLLALALPSYVLVNGLETTPVLETTVNRVLDNVMPGLAVRSSYSLANRLRDLLVGELRRAAAAIAGSIAIVCVAYVGLYSSLVYSAQNRRREFAIRMSCGAKPKDIFETVVREAALSGITAALISGLCWAVLRQFAVSSSMFGYLSWSAFTAVAVISLSFVAALLTALSPALGAARYPIAAALRE
ncbi:MAG: FtsX-like permease family protein, partial [Acidobacteriota bacterium]|nr:FtsX-like permease family protein [Acidobacteriota bacterium]